MRRNCLIPAVLVFVLVASGCGGGNDGDPSGSGDDTPPATFATADSGSAEEIALSAFKERQRAVYSALPLALESARDATAALEAA